MTLEPILDEDDGDDEEQWDSMCESRTDRLFLHLWLDTMNVIVVYMKYMPNLWHIMAVILEFPWCYSHTIL